mmetsp:Transcript_102966/g.258264  ORF Transcript_102966/g.258264 Transcript_102966/m.258264 type:complete len:209 (+) Transcript_102966:977-1603(+)
MLSAPIPLADVVMEVFAHVGCAEPQEACVDPVAFSHLGLWASSWCLWTGDGLPPQLAPFLELSRAVDADAAAIAVVAPPPPAAELSRTVDADAAATAVVFVGGSKRETPGKVASAVEACSRKGGSGGPAGTCTEELWGLRPLAGDRRTGRMRAVLFRTALGSTSHFCSQWGMPSILMPGSLSTCNVRKVASVCSVSKAIGEIVPIAAK